MLNNTYTQSESVQSVVLKAKLQLLHKILPSEFSDEMIYKAVTLGIWDSLIENTPKKPMLSQLLDDRLVELYILAVHQKADPIYIDKITQLVSNIVNNELYSVKEINQYISSKINKVREKYGIVCTCLNCIMKSNKSINANERLGKHQSRQDSKSTDSRILKDIKTKSDETNKTYDIENVVLDSILNTLI